ncbi:hypothetical protein GLYMA_12G173000v4 [Glycine max]|nr:hypothetical protein GLYMA_12G173000v4 [Glycine max]KAH1143616.1 hypothetical protein GYH30_034052 [Glycine max]
MISKLGVQLIVLIINSFNSLSVTNLIMINSPKSHIHVNGREGATFSHINISAPGDDCIAINGGSSNINCAFVCNIFCF